MAAGSVLGENRERIEVWPQGLWIQLSVVVPLGVEVYLARDPEACLVSQYPRQCIGLRGGGLKSPASSVPHSCSPFPQVSLYCTHSFPFSILLFAKLTHKFTWPFPPESYTSFCLLGTRMRKRQVAAQTLFPNSPPCIAEIPLRSPAAAYPP